MIECLCVHTSYTYINIMENVINIMILPRGLSHMWRCSAFTFSSFRLPPPSSTYLELYFVFTHTDWFVNL